MQGFSASRGPVLSGSQVGKAYNSEIATAAASCKALFFQQSRFWLDECNFHHSSPGRRVDVAEDSGD
jgi:hypothetical protein